MARERSPNRDKAKELWLLSGGNKKLKDIAIELQLSDSQIRKWKSQDKWDASIKGNVTNSKGSVTKKSGAPMGNKNATGYGAPKGNKNATGNRGGPGGPLRNDKAVTHGLFREFLPQDPEFLKILDIIEQMEPLDMIWHNINTLFQKIIWSERILFVSDKSDETKVLTKNKETDTGYEQQWEYQHAWDKLANAIKAQATAMREHRALVKQFLAAAPENDERRLKLQQMQQSMDNEKEKLQLMKDKLEFDKKNSGSGETDNGNIDQLAEMIRKSAEAIRGDA